MSRKNRIICVCRCCGETYDVNLHRVPLTKYCSKICRSRMARLGQKHTEETKEKIRLSNTGKKMTEEQKKKMSIARTGIPAFNKGMKRPEFSGENHPRWVKDRTKLKTSRDKMYDTQYKYWMLDVKNRDGWKCKISNNDCSGRLEAHHILGWKEYPELRYQLNNGITLCLAHHPRKRAEEKRLSPYFQSLVSASK